MKITKVRILRYLGLSDLEAIPGEHVNTVKGANGKGKSSFLRAIMEAISGGRKDPWVIHRMGNGIQRAASGDKATADQSDVAEILVELDGDMRIRRRITQNGGDVQVTKKEGGIEVALRSPQAFLDTLVSGDSLNPVAFFRADAKDKKRKMLELVPAILPIAEVFRIVKEHGAPSDALQDFPHLFGLRELGLAEEGLMARRSAAFADKEHHEEAEKAEAAKVPASWDGAPVPDFAGVMARLDAALATATAAAMARQAAQTATSERDRAGDDVARAEREILRIKDMVKDAEAGKELADRGLETATVRAAAAGKAVLEAEAATVDPGPIRAELAALEERRRWSLARDAATAHKASREASAAVVRSCDSAVRAIRKDAPRLLWQRLDATPLKGLDVGMEGDKITVGGIDVEKLSASEQIRFAVRIARATAGELKVICVDGIEALDPVARAAFYAEAAADDFQYFVAEVTDGALEVAEK